MLDGIITTTVVKSLHEMHSMVLEWTCNLLGVGFEFKVFSALINWKQGMPVYHYEVFRSNNSKVCLKYIYSVSSVQVCIQLGLRQLCRHNFEHNRLAKALSIMPA